MAESSTYDATRPVGLLGRCTDCGAIVAAGQTVCHGPCADPEERRHRKLLRMLGHVAAALAEATVAIPEPKSWARLGANGRPKTLKTASEGEAADSLSPAPVKADDPAPAKDALRIDPLILYRAAALAGYNANPKPSIHNANAGQKALWAEEDADALIAVGSEQTS